MNKRTLKIAILALLWAVIIPVSIFAQQRELKVMVHENGIDSTMSNNYYSTMFDVDDISEMHSQLDSILSGLDESFDKKIKVIAFNADSMLSNFYFEANEDFRFAGRLDSMLSMQKMSANDKRVHDLLKTHGVFPDRHILKRKGYDLDSTHYKNMDVEVTTDSIVENGRIIVRKKLIVKDDVVNRAGKTGETENVLIFKNRSEVGNKSKHIIIEKNDARFKPRNTSAIYNHIEEIVLSDAEILVKGGVSPKVISSSPLKVNKLESQIKVKQEYGKEVKTFGMSLTFEDKADLKIILLANDGRVLLEETKKNFTGVYAKDIEIEKTLSPYYFVAIRDKKMFGRVLRD